MANHPPTGDSRAPVSMEQDADPAVPKGLQVSRYFTKPNTHPYDDIEWVDRRSAIYSEKGETIFEVDNVRVPKEWSQLATDIMVSKYFRRAGVPETGSERGADKGRKKNTIKKKQQIK